MTVKQECTICLLIFFGVLFSLIGFIMTMIGTFHKPGKKKAKSRGIDVEIEQEKTHLKNTQIAGIIFLLLGIVSIIYGIILRKRILREHVKQGTDATSSTGGPVMGYAVTGNITSNQTNYQHVPTVYTSHSQSQSTQQIIQPQNPQIQGQPESHQSIIYTSHSPAQQYEPSIQQHQPLLTQTNQDRFGSAFFF